NFFINPGECKLTVKESHLDLPEDSSRLVTIANSHDANLDFVRKSLQEDLVVLIRNVEADRADTVMRDVADGFGLGETLELQAGLAGLKGHRHNIGKYFMSVTQRSDYQFVCPHSEGNSFGNMQLASFFCYENSTDGGESILMNVDESSTLWPSLLEK